jgi:AcrR family transcriptional regulator
MPIKGRTKQDVLLEFRRSEILDAARKVCASRGFHEMTVDDIAQTAGIAKGTVYLYFRSKHDIYWAMVESILAVLHEQMREELAKPGTIEDCIRRFVTTKMTYFEAHQDLLRLYYNEVNSVGAKPPRSRELFDRRYLEQVRLLQSALQAAVADGALRRMRTDLAALSIFELTRGAVVHRSRGWSKGTLREDIEFTFAFIWKGLAGS